MEQYINAREQHFNILMQKILTNGTRKKSRPTQSIMDVPLQENRYRKNVLLIIQYKYLKSCSGDFYSPNLILRTRSCGTGFITQNGWFFHFHLTTLVRWKCFVPQVYQFRRGISVGPALKYFYKIHRGGRGREVCRFQLKRTIHQLREQYIYAGNNDLMQGTILTNGT